MAVLLSVSYSAPWDTSPCRSSRLSIKPRNSGRSRTSTGMPAILWNSLAHAPRSV